METFAYFNEVLWIGFAFLDLSLTLIVFRFLGRTGLFALIAMNVIICNIQVIKVIHLFGMTTTLGNVLYGSIFLITDILGEFYGKKEAQKGVLIGFLILVLTMAYMKITTLYIPDPTDFIQPHMEAIFNLMPRITLASLLAFAVSQTHDVWAFHFWRNKTKGRFLWLRNSSTLLSQFIDTLIFCSVAFIGLFETNEIIQIFISTYIIKAIVSFIDTPFICAARVIYYRWVLPSKVDEYQRHPDPIT